MAYLTGLTFEPGYIVIHMDSGAPVQHPIDKVLRALDIPTGLTHTQVGAITTLANHFVVLMRTLIAKGILDESFLEEGEISLEALIQSFEGMGGDFISPDITVT